MKISRTAGFILAAALGTAGTAAANFDGEDDFAGPQIDAGKWQGWNSDTDYGAFYIQTGRLALNMDWDGGGSSEVAGGMLWKLNHGSVGEDWELVLTAEVPEFTVVTDSEDYDMEMSLNVIGSDVPVTQSYYPRLSATMRRRWDGVDRAFSQEITGYIELSDEDVRGIAHEIPAEVAQTEIKVSWNADSALLCALYRLDDGNAWWNLLGSWTVYSGVIHEPGAVFTTTVQGELDGFRGLPGIYTPGARGFAARPYRSTTGTGAVTGDFTGDGFADIALFRPSSGLWLVRGTTRVYFGTSGDEVVSHDYDGDGTWDMAVYRPSTGKWMVRGGLSSYYGNSTDVPVPGDYDGDGTAQPAVYRPASGKWMIRGSTAAYYGNSTDLPVSY
ncbi:MAG TPA: hypothetical protein PLI51_01355 [bacterium]|nr:hypothetical protein [bacterium]HPQ65360.1 hypothetical protein [bacterium]